MASTSATRGMDKKEIMRFNIVRSSNWVMVEP
jgi:hypothetical protein